MIFLALNVLFVAMKSDFQFTLLATINLCLCVGVCACFHLSVCEVSVSERKREKSERTRKKSERERKTGRKGKKKRLLFFNYVRWNHLMI